MRPHHSRVLPVRVAVTLPLALLISVAGLAQSPIRAVAPAAITADPAPDKANFASIESFQLPSNGALLNALMYVAAGAGPHPAVVLLHGFPGNEKNLDLAQALRRAGYNVLFFNYRGSWGSPGNFSFQHCIEDATAALAYLRDPANAKRLHSDPASIYVIGHSMGGFVAAYVASHDAAPPAIAAPGSSARAAQPTAPNPNPVAAGANSTPLHAPLKGVVFISAADMVALIPDSLTPEQMEGAVKPIAKALAAEGMAPLAGTSPEDLARELITHQADWDFRRDAPLLGQTPMLLITSDDGLAAPVTTLAAQLFTSGNRHVTSLHIADDHVYSNSRIALEASVLNWLATQPR